LKIALITELFWPCQLGGGERQFFELAKYLAKKKHEVHVYTIKLPGTSKEEVHNGIHIHRIGLLAHPLNQRALLPHPFYILSLFFSKLPKDVDLIHCHGYLPCVMGFIKARLYRKPVTAVIHDVYLGTWGRTLGSRLLGPVGDFIEKIVCKLPYDKIVTVSSATKQNLVKTFGLKAEKIVACGSGIDVELIDSVKFRKKKNQIIYVGRLVPHKHVDELILAVQKLRSDIPDIKCKIVGDGVLKEKLEKMIENLDLRENVELLGTLPEYKDVISLIKSSEILVLPSTKEGFGLVVLEAMRCKTVPVVYELAAYRDFASTSEVAITPPRDVGALASSISGLLRKRKKLNKMAKSGFRTSANHTWEKFAMRVQKVFFEVHRSHE
jgi:glycosyltransferase involved in cell wall biosynthesis